MSDKANGLTEAELRELATRGAAELEGANATDLLHWTDEHFGGIRGPRPSARSPPQERHREGHDIAIERFRGPYGQALDELLL